MNGTSGSAGTLKAPVPSHASWDALRTGAGFVASCAFVVYLSATLAYIITNDALHVRLAQGSGLVLLGFQIVWPRRVEWPIYLFLAVAVTAFGLRMHVQGLRSLGDLLHLLAAAGAAMAFLRHPPAARVLRFLVWACGAYFGYSILQNVLPSQVLAERSANHVSVLMLTAAVAANLQEARRGGRISLSPAVLAALASTWALGRSGIAGSYLYLAGVLWLRRDAMRTLRFWIVSAALAVWAGFVLVRYWALAELWLLSSFRKFRTKGVLDDPRWRVLRDYMTGLDVEAFLLGPTPTAVSSLGLSLHNSFLHWHYLFGAPALALMAVTAWAALRALRAGRWFLVLALGVLVFRGFTDTVLFPGALDAVFLTLLCLGLAPALMAPPPAENHE